MKVSKFHPGHIIMSGVVGLFGTGILRLFTDWPTLKTWLIVSVFIWLIADTELN